MNSKLYALLKELRLTIATEQKVPAFVIFSDSTLIDMCLKLPTTNEELLEVSGVGQVKLKRYGEMFLRAIAEFKPESDETPATPLPETTTNQQLTAIELSDEAVTISVIADRLNCHLIQCGQKKLTGAKINDWLISEGFLEVVVGDYGKNVRRPTLKGTELGINAEERVIRGVDCSVNFYGRAAQGLIVARVTDILRFAQ
jgi:ATP-dependent DNA helicase RecQ